MKMKLWMGFLVMGLFFGIGQWAASGGNSLFASERHTGHRPGVLPVQNQVYAEECGACHFAYPPGLLPAKNWKKIMTNLSNHFGDNAELEPAVEQALLSYAMENAADRALQKRSVKIMRSLKGREASLRITELPYILHKHHEIPKRFIQGNADVGSLSNCTACHTLGEKGIFEEHSVKIPGAGGWHD